MNSYIPITDVCDFEGGTQPPKSEWSKTEKDGYIRMLQIRDFTQADKEKIEYIKDTKKLKKCNYDDILIGRYGASIGKILSGLSGAYNVAIVKTIPDPKRLCKPYLKYLLEGIPFQTFIKNVGVRAAQAGFNKGELEGFRIPLPPLETQKKIAAILDKADKLRQNDKKILEKYDQLAQSVFLEMFGDQRNDFRGFTKIQLKDIIIDGPQNGLYKPANSYGKGTPIIRIDTFNNSIVNISNLKRVDLDKDEISSYEIKEGEFLINRVNSMSHLGKCGLVPEVNERTVFESNMMRLRFNLETVTNTYMLYILSSRYIKNQIIKCSKNAVNQSSINQTDVNSFVIPLPPIELQNKFGILIKNLNLQKLFTNESIKRSEDLFQSLLQRAFRGEL